MNKNRKIEFFITPDGKVMVNEVGRDVREFEECDRELCTFLLELIERQYPEALVALSKTYAGSKLNKMHYDFLRVHRFIRCNFGKFDGLTYDVDDGVLHLEEVDCPLRCECPMAGVICKPRPFGLTKREEEIARLVYSGRTYEEVSQELGIAHSTIKNIIQKIKDKLNLASSKDLAKIFIAVL